MGKHSQVTIYKKSFKFFPTKFCFTACAVSHILRKSTKNICNNKIFYAKTYLKRLRESKCQTDILHLPSSFPELGAECAIDDSYCRNPPVFLFHS